MIRLGIQKHSSTILPLPNLPVSRFFKHSSICRTDSTTVCISSLKNLGFARFASGTTKFDTKKFVQSLQTEGGFDKRQAETAVKIVNKAINDGISSITQNLVTKEVLSSTAYQQKVNFAKLKGELMTMDKLEFTSLKKEQEKLRTDLSNLKNRLKEEITKNQAGVRLDLNLEKGRIREEGSIHELKIEDTYTRIDEEIANIQMQIKSVKTQVMQWLIGVTSGTFALLLAFVRFFG